MNQQEKENADEKEGGMRSNHPAKPSAMLS